MGPWDFFTYISGQKGEQAEGRLGSIEHTDGSESFHLARAQETWREVTGDTAGKID
jgi:hypothetical protein